MLLATSGAFATTVTGTVKDSQGNPVSGATVRLQLENCGAGGVCTLTGGGGIVSTLPVQTTTATDGTFSIVVNGNDTITPAGTFYEVRYIAASGTIYSANYNVTGTSFNLNTATPLGAMPPAPTPAAYTTLEQGGSTLQQRQLLNFTGSGVSCADNTSLSRTDCTVTSGGGSGTVTSVGLSLPSSLFGVSGSPVTTSGTLTGSFNTQNANLLFAGPSSGAAAIPTFRALVGADIPVPSATTLGGIESYSAVAHQWVNAISTSGVPASTQPNFTDLLGSLALGQTPLTTQGDLLFANSTPALARLAIGTNGQCLTSNGTTVVWGACASGSGVTLETGGTNNSSQTTLNFQNGSTVAGIQIQPTNPSGGNEQMAITGILTVPGGGTGLGTLAAHDLYVGNGTSNPNAVATGNSGQVLISNGASADPTFGDPVVSGPDATGVAPTKNPVQTGAIDNSTACSSGPCVRSLILANSTPAGTEYGLITRNIPSGAQPVSGTFWQATQPVSGTVTANAGTGTFTTNDTTLDLGQASTTSGEKGPLVQGAVTTSAPSYTTAQTSPLSLTTAGALRVDGSAVTQPVSGTVTTTPPANASTNVAQVAGTTAAVNNGTSGAGDLRMNIASDNTAIANWGQGATGSAVPSGGQYVAGNGSGNLTGIISCDNSSAINISTATTAQIIAISGTGGRTFICSINLVTAAANNIALVSGSGTNCASNLAGLAGGTTAATGWNFAANGGLTMGSGLGMIIKTATTNNEVCLVTSATTQLSGSVTWTQF